MMPGRRRVAVYGMNVVIFYSDYDDTNRLGR